MRFPNIQIVNRQRHVAAAMMRVHGQFAITNQVKLLIFTQQKPRSRKIKIGAIHYRQRQNVSIKDNTSRHIGNVKRDVIQLAYFHDPLIP